jgi:DNA-binding transcriptional LysR family regulator
VLSEIARSHTITDRVRTAPRGRLRIACPLNLAQNMLAPVLAAFLAKYPDVELALEITNRTAALTQQGYDFALHIGSYAKHPTLVTSAFAVDREVLVASPALLARFGAPRRPSDLKSLPSAAGQVPPDPGGRYVWHLSGPGNARQAIQHFPRLLAEDLWVIRESVLAGCTVAALPPLVCRDAVDDGRLVQVLPDWTLRQQKLLVTYPSRQGLTLAARTLIDFISSQLRAQLRGLQDGTLQLGVSPYRSKAHLAT